MSAMRSTGILLFFVYGLHLPQVYAQDIAAAATPMAVVNVNLVDVAAGQVVPDQSVLISGQRIIFVGDLDSSGIEPDTFVVNGDGLYLVPGFWDMHAHLAYPGAELISGPAMVANGVMYARDMSGDCIGEECSEQKDITGMRDLESKIETGQVLGPELVAIGSYAVEGPNIAYGELGRPRVPSFLAPRTESQGRSLARYMSDRGVDFIKSYDSIPFPAYMGMISEATLLKLPVAGHVPKSILLIEAIEAGQRTVDHARMLPLACSAVEEVFRDDYTAWLDADIQRTTSKHNTDAKQLPEIAMWAYYRAVLDEFDDQKCQRYIREWAGTDVHYVPTHVTRQAETIMHFRAFFADPRLRYVNEEAVAEWEESAAFYSARFAAHPGAEQNYLDYHLRSLQLTGRAYRAGVKILVGTDVGDTLIYPGFSFHDELGLLADAGMPPDAVLRSATLLAAAFSGRDATEGTITAGKTANFVLLRANPLLDIGNTKSIEAVHYMDRFYDRSALDAILTAVASAANGLQVPQVGDK
ncbi:MAG TPA: amidohydrolase family protein [Woeseiaceae bacterium]|nr:amidohydrolase family protein [Woeseiaceae bacterium]